MGLNRIATFFATLGPIGYAPVAPGTFGTLAASVLFLLLKPSDLVIGMILLLTIPAGIFSSHIAERVLAEKDSSHIIIDEFCGYYVSLLFVPFSLGHAIAAFFLFRFFDILKPFPIRNLERLKGGAGIMADDVMAGIYSNVILQIWIIIH